MNRWIWSQAWVLLLAVVISLYFWLGAVAFIVYVVVGVAVIAVWIARYIARRRADIAPSAARKSSIRQLSKSDFQQRNETIAARRKEQCKHFFDVVDGVSRRLPEQSRLIERLMGWYSQYLSEGTAAHKDLYDYLLVEIKERMTTARASYLKRELELSKRVVRALMRRCDEEQIIEILTQNDNAESDS